MIISDLNHIETVREDNQIEGGYGSEYSSGSFYAGGSGIGVGAGGYSYSNTGWYGTSSGVGASAGAYIGGVSVGGGTSASSGYYYPYYYYY